MINIVICDDSEDYMTSFKGVVDRQFFLTLRDEQIYRIGASFRRGAELLEYASDNRIDVLFLETDMPEMNGFEIAKAMKKDHGNTLIVFMSTFDEFAFCSFDYLPFAYMRKDRITEDLPKLVLRIRDKLLEQIRYITLPDEKREIAVDVKEVLYFESNRNYYVAHLSDGTSFSCRGTLSGLEKKMRPFGFFRTHSAFLVNLELAEGVAENRYVVIGKKRIPIAQKRAKEVKTVFRELSLRHVTV